ncbi:hypothetical protein [Micromonospora sp. DT62]|uniref:hypothetical protein n=1 Tax=Micromonospora sp. DT62 TaxID=3416521 RepID=UPI003CECF1BB
MTAALALEQLMLHPRYHQLVDAIRAATPAGLVDQADAATRDALRFMTAAARHANADSAHPTAAADVPDWVRLGLLDTLTAWADGRVSTCRHQPTPDRPQPVLAAAWKPNLLVCAACAHLLALPRNSDRDRTCDACGHQCTGPEHADGIYPGMVQLGPLIYQYGTCAGCRPPTADIGPLSATQTAEQAAPRGTGRVRQRGSRGRGRRGGPR